ncbi:MAG TPA: J domain-containing protein [Polyangia bacterium]|nr:J domain-containing protein [Polyangia bacterium]
MTYYEVLEIDSRATSEEIERAYRRLARQVHPDLHPGLGASERTNAEARMKLLNEIRDTLTDPLLRAGYDERLRLEAAQRGGAARAAAPPPVATETDAPTDEDDGRRGRPALWAGLVIATLGAGDLGIALFSGARRATDEPSAERLDLDAGRDTTPLLVAPVAPKHAAPAPQPETRPVHARQRGRFVIRIGSTADDVLQALGPPDRYEPGRHPGEAVLHYGRLRLEIRNGRVVGGDAAR